MSAFDPGFAAIIIIVITVLTVVAVLVIARPI